MSNPSQLFLLADHIKLSLLERQRALSNNIDPNPSQFSNISRSLESFRETLETLEKSPQQDSSAVDQLQRLRTQYSDLSQQFYGENASTTLPSSMKSPNDPALAADFDRAQKATGSGRGSTRGIDGKPSKSVHFSDHDDEENRANRSALFPAKYTDDPDAPKPDPTEEMSNQQIHTYHTQVMAEQDEQLDRLGESIGRQRDISIQIGDELDGQIALLDEVDQGVDRQQGRLDGASRRLKTVGSKAKENWGMTTIIVLIVILVLLIVLLK